MFHRSALLTLAALLATTLPALAQEKYTIIFKKSVKGQTEQVQSTEAEESDANIVDKDGKVVKELGKTKKTTTYERRETVLEKAPGARWSAKSRVTYTKAEETSGDKTTPLPLQGLTVLVERKGTEYHFKNDKGGDLSTEAIKALQKKFPNDRKDDAFDPDRAMLPARPVAAGETWEIDPAPFVKDFNAKLKEGPRVTVIGFKATGKLIKAYKKDGRQFGVLEFELVMPMEAFQTADGKKLAVTKESRMIAKAVMDRCIDGSVEDGTLTAQMTMNLTVVRPDQLLVHVIGMHKQSSKNTEVSK